MSGEGLKRRIRERTQDPLLWSDLIQITKTAVAAVIAWVIATSVLHLPQSFLAPWSALLVVHATVYRTFSQGARQVGAAVIGVVLAWAVGNALGLDTVAVAVALLLGLGLGAFGWFRTEETTIAATALIVLTTGFSGNDAMLLTRLADTGIGIAVGLLVNLMLWPPLRRRAAIAAMNVIDDLIGELLVDIADGVEAGCTAEDAEHWADRTRSLDEMIDHAWSLVRQAQESAWMNPRRQAVELRDPRQWTALLQRMEHAVAETRSMVSTLAHGTAEAEQWQPEFRGPYLQLLREVGRAIAEAESARIAETRERLDRLIETLRAQEATPLLWPVYGGLIINLRNLIHAMDEVAEASPLSQPPLPMRGPG